MAELSDKQAQFCSMVGQLLSFVESLPGYRVRFGEAWRRPGIGHPQSLHAERLAIDLILDIKDASGEWVYQRDSESYEVLGLFWESLGGSWGGRFSSPDGNHFSLAHNGVR